MPYDFPVPVPFTPTVDFSEVMDFPLSQYLDSPRLTALMRELIRVPEESVGDILQTMDRANNVRVSDGVLLDWIGIRLGIIRPRVASRNAIYFGLEGTEGDGGRPLNQAPFFTRNLAVRAQEPVGDETFRCVITARARRLFGDVGMDAWDDCLRLLFEQGGNAAITSVGAMAVTVTMTRPAQDIADILSTGYRDFVLPTIPGVDYTLTTVA